MSDFPKITANKRFPRLAIIAALALLQAVASGGAAFATREIFAELSQDVVTITLLPVIFIALSGAAIAIFRWYERMVSEKLGQEFAAELRINLFKHIAHLPSTELAKRRLGGLSLRFVGDLSAIRSWVSRGVTRLLTGAIVMPIIAIVLLHIHQELAIAALIPLIFGLLFMAAAGPSLLRSHTLLRSRRSKLAANVTERLPYAGELRLLGRLDRELRQIERHTATMITTVLDRQRIASMIRIIPDFTSGVAVALLLAVALNGNVSGAETAGALAALGMLIQKMRELGAVWDRYCAWNAARKRCLVLFAAKQLPTETDNIPKKGHRVGAQVRLRKVCGYGFDNISAIAKPGEKIGILGANGSGKSLLLRLIGGMEQPLAGHIELDRYPATSWVINSKKHFIYLNADSPILSGSLRRALTMGMKRRPNDEEIERVAGSYGLANVLQRLGGLNGHIAEAGRNLSTGETGRILLTRAALSNAQLILLDEPDKNLDDDGKALVRKLLLDTGATIFLVSHDRNQLQYMDKFWQLEEGKLSVLTENPASLTPQLAN
ncbi:MAG: ABC transporter ATP-binding protein [Desulfocapsaceae bacterium]|nr:ABC transporter ATP-binding protein [Desulfocapsaceae bacterium]